MRRILSVATVAALVLAPVAGAQRRAAPPSGSDSSPIELGFDGGLGFGTGGTNNATVLSLPIQSVRAGFMVSPAFSIEPSLALSHASQTGLSTTNYSVGLGALYHFSPMRTEHQLYVRPFVNYVAFSSKEDVGTNSTLTTSDSYTEMGAGLGVKLPWKDRLAWRLEANMAHLSKQFASGNNVVGVLFGMSYYTH